MTAGFRQLNTDDQTNRISTPMLVSVTENPDNETREMIANRHERFLKLPEKIKGKLASVLTSQKIQSIGKKYGFELLRLANITRLIREYYFGEVRLEDFPGEIEKRMSVSLLVAQEIARYLKQEIIDWDPWAEYLAKLPKISAREIVTKHPKVAEQEITGGYLEFKERPDDIFDPTIKNWLRDYVGHLGQTGHTSVDRMKYLFYSENTRDLSSPDREKLGIILKSFDENAPLPVDTENNEVVFDISEQQAPKQNELATEQVARIEKGVERKNEEPARDSFIKPYPPIFRPAGNAAGRPAASANPQFQPRPIQQKMPSPPVAAAKPQIQSRPVQTQIPARLASRLEAGGPDTKYPASPAGRQIPDTIRYANPYPSPGTHETPSSPAIAGEPEMAGASPIKMKGFSEGATKHTKGSASSLLSKVRPFPSPTESREIPQGRTFPAPPRPYVPRHPKNVIYPRSRTGEEKPEPKIEGNVVDLSGNND